jgi:hypothetical protein
MTATIRALVAVASLHEPERRKRNSGRDAVWSQLALNPKEKQILITVIITKLKVSIKKK